MKKADNEIKEKVEMYRLPVSTMNEVLEYLASKPYKESVNLIQSILTNGENEK